MGLDLRQARECKTTTLRNEAHTLDCWRQAKDNGSRELARDMLHVAERDLDRSTVKVVSPSTCMLSSPRVRSSMFQISAVLHHPRHELSIRRGPYIYRSEQQQAPVVASFKANKIYDFCRSALVINMEGWMWSIMSGAKEMISRQQQQQQNSNSRERTKKNEVQEMSSGNENG